MTRELKLYALSINAGIKTFRMTEAQYLRMCRKYRGRKGKPHQGLETFREEVHNARVHECRQNARAAHLARMYAKGKPYHVCESNPRWKRENPDRPKPDVQRITELLNAFGKPEHRNAYRYVLEDQVEDWLKVEA